MRRVSTSLLLSILFLTTSYCQEYRSLDGTGNHPLDWGSISAPLNQYTTSSFSDSISEPSGWNRPNERVISNTLFSQTDMIMDPLNLSDFVWVFGQFIEHDIVFVEDSENEYLSITVPEDDEVFAPNSDIFMLRSQKIEGTGTDINNPRQYRNSVTSYLDLSSVYGCDEARSKWLRESDGSGKLKTSQGNLLPWNTPSGEFNDTDLSTAIPSMIDKLNNQRLFVAGDVRANENPLLIAIHTLFVREHNRLCDHYLEKHPSWLGNDEKLYQNARKHLIAYYQSVVFDEWLPAMGIWLPDYTGYKTDMNPSIMNVFSAATFNIGLTLNSGTIVRMDNSGRMIPNGDISYRDAYFKPIEINHAGGVEPYFKGMASQIQQNLDCKVVDAMRNYVIDDVAMIGKDYAAINVKRGRERGIADYNTIRDDFGMPPMNNFFSLTGSQDAAAQLESLYGDVDNIDPWVGMLAERHNPDALFGELALRIIERQFQLLRDGDSYYYQHGDQFEEHQMDDIANTSFHDIIMRNTTIDLMQENVFVAMPHSAIPTGPDLADVQLDAVAYPNPTKSKFHIKIFADIQEVVTFSLYGVLGELISTNTMVLDPGDNFTSYSIPEEMPRGMYNLFMETPSARNVLRIVKEN